MSLAQLWMTIEPGHDETLLMLTAAGRGPVLRARLPPVPHQAGSLRALLEALSAWFGEPLTAVVDADAQASALRPHRWSQLLGEIGSDLVKVEWVVVPTAAERDLFLGEIARAGRAARRRLTFARSHRSRAEALSPTRVIPYAGVGDFSLASRQAECYWKLGQ